MVLGCGGARLGLGDVQWMQDTALVITLPGVPGVNTFVNTCYFHFSLPHSTAKPAFWSNPHTGVVVFPADRAYFNIPVAGFREESSLS